MNESGKSGLIVEDWINTLVGRSLAVELNPKQDGVVDASRFIKGVEDNTGGNPNAALVDGLQGANRGRPGKISAKGPL